MSAESRTETHPPSLSAEFGALETRPRSPLVSLLEKEVSHLPVNPFPPYIHSGQKSVNQG